MWSKNCRASVQQLCERGKITCEYIQRIGVEHDAARPCDQNALDELARFVIVTEPGTNRDAIGFLDERCDLLR